MGSAGVRRGRGRWDSEGKEGEVMMQMDPRMDLNPKLFVIIAATFRQVSSPGLDLATAYMLREAYKIRELASGRQDVTVEVRNG